MAGNMPLDIVDRARRRIRPGGRFAWHGAVYQGRLEWVGRRIEVVRDVVGEVHAWGPDELWRECPCIRAAHEDGRGRPLVSTACQYQKAKEIAVCVVGMAIVVLLAWLTHC